MLQQLVATALSKTCKNLEEFLTIALYLQSISTDDFHKALYTLFGEKADGGLSANSHQQIETAMA
ncbi:MAG: hypothetical protein ACTS73_03925 [Arsenophonus sp. NEOnobi-MAG3]